MIGEVLMDRCLEEDRQAARPNVIGYQRRRTQRCPLAGQRGGAQQVEIGEEWPVWNWLTLQAGGVEPGLPALLVGIMQHRHAGNIRQLAKGAVFLEKAGAA